jgi:hypothetical protein
MRVLGNALLLAGSLLLSLLAAELVVRIMFDPLDYLLPNLVEDEFLFYRVAGNTGGHDAWGYRNIRVPQSADIVCVGDSMTYGIAAQARDSWPRDLERVSGASVYNMGVGGYGPIQYLYLMQTKAIKLHPKTVIVGFYLGNDLIDVYNEVRFNKNWGVYGKLDGTDSKPVMAFQSRPGKFLGGLRDWLSRHSVFYALLSTTPVSDFFRERELRNSSAADPEGVLGYRDQKHSVVFIERTFLDLGDPRVGSALEITKRVLLDMRSVADQNSFRLVVALIPTKRRVYGNLMDRAGDLRRYPQLANAVRQEDAVRDTIVGFLHENSIEAVDLLPALERDVEEHDPYPHTDMHPNKDGYRVIAEAINNYLSDSPRVGAALAK